MRTYSFNTATTQIEWNQSKSATNSVDFSMLNFFRSVTVTEGIKTFAMDHKSRVFSDMVKDSEVKQEYMKTQIQNMVFPHDMITSDINYVPDAHLNRIKYIDLVNHINLNDIFNLNVPNINNIYYYIYIYNNK